MFYPGQVLIPKISLTVDRLQYIRNDEGRSIDTSCGQIHDKHVAFVIAVVQLQNTTKYFNILSVTSEFGLCWINCVNFEVFKEITNEKN